jgi:hypothetical protein
MTAAVDLFRDDVVVGPLNYHAARYWSAMFVKDVAVDLSVSPWASAMMHSPRFSLERSRLSTVLHTASDRAGSISHSDRDFVGMVIGTHLKTNG